MDCINIYNLEVFANHGVLKEENVLGQKFVVSVNMYMDTTKAASEDNVEKTVNYAQVCMDITNHFKENTYQLIETVANEIAMMILRKYSVLEKVDVEVKKPWAPVHLPLDSVSVKVTRKRHTIYVGLGSNMGDKTENLNKALKIIDEDEDSYVYKVSEFISTKPYGYTNQDDFVNGAACIRTLRNPHEFLKLIGVIEKKLNRVRQIHWGPRTIDVDILLYDNEIIRNDELIIPHIEMHKRDFVLKPLCDIAPQAYHPVLCKSVAALYDELISLQED